MTITHLKRKKGTSHKTISLRLPTQNDDGIMIAFNNNGYYNSNQLPFWDCSWISPFHAEQETLWFGGRFPMKIVNICCTAFGTAYRDFLKTMNGFDLMFLAQNRILVLSIPLD